MKMQDQGGIFKETTLMECQPWFSLGLKRLDKHCMFYTFTDYWTKENPISNWSWVTSGFCAAQSFHLNIQFWWCIGCCVDHQNSVSVH